VLLGEAAGNDRELALAVADPEFQWSAEDALLLRTADELTAQNGLSDPRWNALAERYENDQLIELLFVVGFYGMVCCYVNTLRRGRRRVISSGVAGPGRRPSHPIQDPLPL
jgi:hypothetical protein